MLTCYLCLEKRPNQIKLNTKKAKELNCKSIIEQHFWLEPDLDKSFIEKSICLKCWDILFAFHELYQSVVRAHNYLESKYEVASAAFDPEIKVEITDLHLLPKTAIIDHADGTNQDHAERQIDLDTNDFEIDSKQEFYNVTHTSSEEDSDIDIPLSMLLRSKTKPELDALEIANEPVSKNKAVTRQKCKQLASSKKAKTTNNKRTTKTESTTSYELEDLLETASLSESEDDYDSSASEKDNKKDEDFEPYESNEKEIKRKRRAWRENCTGRRLKWDETISKCYEKLECATCKNQFDSFRALSQHSLKIHQSKPAIECCKRIFQARKTLSNHALTHLNPQDLACSKCDTAFENKLLLQEHIDTNHRCSICAKDFQDKTNLNVHNLIKHTPKSEYKHDCPDCREKFPLKKRLWEHLAIVHGKGNPTICDKCGKTLRNKHSLKKHMLMHSDLLEHKTEAVQCDICGKWLKHQDSLRGHIYLLHERRYEQSCSICNKNMPSVHALERHMIHSHQAERKFRCPMCPRAFKVNRDLQQHINIHTRAIVYKCDICAKNFYQTSSLHKHKSVYHPNNRVEEPDPVQCEICKHFFKTLPGLKQHMKVLHAVSDREHRCHICSHVASNGTALKRHVRRNHYKNLGQRESNERQSVELILTAEA